MHSKLQAPRFEHEVCKPSAALAANVHVRHEATMAQAAARTFFSRACSGVSWLIGVSMIVPPELYAGVAPKPGVAPTAGVAAPAMGPAGVSSHLQRTAGFELPAHYA